MATREEERRRLERQRQRLDTPAQQRAADTRSIREAGRRGLLPVGGEPITALEIQQQRESTARTSAERGANMAALGAIGREFASQGPGLITNVMQARNRALTQARSQPVDSAARPPGDQALAATDAMAGQGFATSRGGQQRAVPGTRQAQSRLSVVGDLGAAADEFSRAADIMRENRQRETALMDGRQPGAQRGGSASSGLSRQRQEIEQRITQLTQRAGSTRNQYDRARLRGSVEALQEQADRLGAMERARLGADTDLQRTQLGEEAATERTAMQVMAQSDDGMRAYNQARAEAQQLANEALRTGTALEPPVLDADTIEGLQAAGRSDLAEQEVLRYQAQRDVYDMGQIARSLGISVDQLLAEYAAGEIPEGTRAHDILSRVSGGSNDVQRFADGGLVGGVGVTGAGIGGQDPVEAEYQEYAQGAQRIGVQPIPFEQFMEFRQPVIAEPQPAPDQTQPFGVMGFADGGYVPQPGDAGINAMDVSGRQVIDPDPNAPTDSIPAVIDGRQPAALDSGEFVIPDHVVRFHGLKALQKLIDQAEQSNGSNPGTTQTA